MKHGQRVSTNVSNDEADPAAVLLSFSAPLSRALIGAENAIKAQDPKDQILTYFVREAYPAFQPNIDDKRQLAVAMCMIMLFLAHAITLHEFCVCPEAAGWQPHTARAALTGLKKKGHTIMSRKVDKVTRYKLA